VRVSINYPGLSLNLDYLLSEKSFMFLFWVSDVIYKFFPPTASSEISSVSVFEFCCIYKFGVVLQK